MHPGVVSASLLLQKNLGCFFVLVQSSLIMLLDCCVFFLMGSAAVAVVGIGSGLRSDSATREEIVSKDHVIQIIAVEIQEL